MNEQTPAPTKSSELQRFLADAETYHCYEVAAAYERWQQREKTRKELELALKLEKVTK